MVTTGESFALPANGLVDVVGESYRQDVLRGLHTTGSGAYLAEVSGRARRVAEDQFDGRWFRAVLRPEPANEYDANAIAVDAETGGQVGYLSRANALAYQAVFAELATRGITRATCPAYLIGEDRPEQSLGVMLCLSEPDAILETLR